jgi:hypothetical protein
MNNALLSTLQSYYEEDSTDPFNVYALAIEYTKWDAGKARLYFDILLAEHADYLPTYYQAAGFFASQEDVERAELIYNRGIELARNQKNVKAQHELQRAYNNFLDEIDE